MPRFLKNALAAILLLISLPALAVNYGQLQNGQSRISFVSSQMGVPVNGQFRRFSAQMEFDPAHPESGHARIEVDLASIDAGSNEANEEVVGKDWFHVRNFPSAVFESRSVKALGGGRFEVPGSLLIKGRRRDMLVTVSFREESGQGIFEGGFVLKRLDFGIGEGPWGDPDTVADAVQVKLKLSLKPAIPAKTPK